MKKRLLSVLQYAFFLGLGIFLIWLTVRGLNEDQWSQLENALAGARYWLLIPVLFAILISHLSRAIRWKILMGPLGYKPGTLNTFLAVMIGYLANLAVPRLGEVLKCTILAKYEKVPADKLIGTIVAERAFDLICLIIVFSLTILTQIDTISVFTREQFSQAFAGSGTGVATKILLYTGILIAIIVLVKFLFNRFKHLPFIQKTANFAIGIWQGITSVRYVKKKGWFFFHTMAIWFLYFISIRIGFYAMESTAHLGIPEALSILSFGSIAMILTQGGIGAYQFLVQKVMLVYKLSEVEGLAFGWLLWGSQTAVFLLGGIVCIGLLPVVNRKKMEPLPAVQL